MNVLELLSQLRQAKIQLSLDGEKLKIKAPQGAVTPEIKENLKALKQEIIEFLRESQKSAEPALQITPADRSAELPLSYTQKAVWTLDKLNPGSIAYNLPMAFKFTGNLDIDVLEGAVQTVLKRHESTRLLVVENDEGEPVAQFNDVGDQVIRQHHLQVERATDYEAQVREIVDALATKPFDLSSDPLYRFDLVAIQGDVEPHHVFVICLHHIVSDGLSQNLLVREIAIIYGALLQGQPTPFPPLPIQYVDFAAWQKQMLSGEKLDREIQFWKDQLQGVPSLLALPTDRPRPLIQTTNGAKYHFDFDDNDASTLIELCQKKGITLFMGLMAALQVVLSRHAQQQDFCIGMPTAGRSVKELEQLIGFFVNGVLVRADLKGNLTWEEHITRVKQRVLDVMTHQNTPAQLIMDNLDIPRNPSYPPLAQVGFQLQNFAGAVQGGDQDKAMLETFKSMTNLTMEPLRLEEADSKFDMIISVSQNDAKLGGYVEYNTDLFDESTIERIVGHWVAALQSMGQGDARINQIPLDSHAQLNAYLGVQADEKRMRLTTTQLAFVQDVTLRPETKQYAVGFRYKIDKRIQPELLKQAIAHVCNSYDILKARFVRCDLPWAEEAYQVVRNQFAAPLDIIDISDQSQPDEFVARHHDRWCYVAHDIFNDCLVNFQLMEHKTCSWLLLATHHIVLDGVAGIVVLERIAQTYDQLVETGSVPEFNDQFEKYIERHHKDVDQPDAITYWKDKAKTVSPLSYSLPKAWQKTNEYQIHQHSVSADLLEKVKQYCRKKKTHPSIFFRLVSALVIQQYCRPEDDFVLWDIQTGRTPAEAQDVGVYYQQVPYIIEKEVVSGDSCADRFFKQQRLYRKQIKDNTFISLQALNTLFPAGSLSFQFNYFNFLSEVEMDGVSAVPHFFSSHVDNTVQIFIKDYSQSMVFELWFDGSAFVSLEFLERMALVAEQLVAADPEFSLLQYALESEHNNQKAWNDTAVELPSHSNLVDWFYSACEVYSEKPAILHNSTQMTYAELNTLSNQLAGLLIQQGVQRGSRVGVCVGRNPWFLVSVFATVKAGGTYIPIEPGYPADRINYILEDSQAKLLLTEQCIRDRLTITSCECLLVDRLDDVASQPKNNVQVDLQPSDALYIIYTSGSTGKPKGAVVTHAGEINLLSWYTKQAKFAVGDRAIIISAFGFDLTQKNLFAPLLSGAAVVIPSMEEFDGDAVVADIEQHQVTHINCAPSAFYSLVEPCDAARGKQLQSLKMVYLGGEAIRLSALNPWLALPTTAAQVVNSYGPTECTDVVSYHKLAQVHSEQQTIPIGAPIYNTQLYVINDNLKPVPHGSIGEIAVCGQGVGLGYLNRPELTASVFVDSPFDDGLLYRTGDLGRYLPNGEIEYIGRKDFQIKLRGLRIELGEIEAALKALDSVVDALVVVREEQLIAYGVVENGLGDWQAELRAALPEYMVPAQFIALESWPLTPNGKIDRKALPVPDQALQQLEFVEPRNEVEFAIANIWAQVLKQDKVGVTNSFFDLGGHSLLANQIVTRIRKQFEVELPIRDLIAYPTVGQLAERVEKAKQSKSLGEIKPASRDQRLPLSAPQKRLWLLDKIEPGNPAYHVPSILKVRGDLDIEKLSSAFSSLINHHEGLRAQFKEDEQGPYQVFLPPQSWKVEVNDFSGLDEASAKRSVAALVIKPFQLEEGPLFRAHVCKLSQNECVLVVVLHHIITDGWSNGILVQQLGQAYVQLLSGNSVQLPANPLHYADFAVWQNAQLDADTIDSKLAFWSEQLSDVPVLELPIDFPRPSVQTFSGASHGFKLSSTASNNLAELAKQYQCTPFMLLLASYSILLQKYSGQDDFAIGTPVAGRDRLELEKVVGFFVNTVAIRVQPKAEFSFSQYIDSVKESTLSSFEHQDIPFEEIVDHLNPNRDMSRSPLFQVMMAYQNLPVGEGEFSEAQLGDVQFSAYELNVETAKFEQTLTLWPENGITCGSLTYNTDLFSQTSTKRFVEHFVALCEHLFAHPDLPLYQANYLTDAEVDQQLITWNQTATPYNQSIRLNEWFDRTASEHVNNTAVVCGSDALSYLELQGYSNHVAQQLKENGVQQGDSVGLVLDRNIHITTALLGIIKAGAIYVPIDAAYPPQRIQTICEQSGIEIVLTQEHLVAIVPEGLTPVLFEQQLAQCHTVPDIAAQPDDIIYTIFTSGSTGLPKGTQVYHRSIINLLNWYTQQFNMTSNDRVLLLSSIGFDLTQKNLFAPLMSGARLVIPEFQEYDPLRLIDCIEKEEITWINCAPSAFYPLIDNSDDWGRLASLRYVFLGGEPINLARVQDWLQQSNCKLINSYGPTECADIAAWHEVALNSDLQKPVLPIGKPNYNVQLYILGDHQELLPAGAVGELCISGDGVGPGYVNQPQQTDSVFVQHPYIDDSIIYRTGDRARFDENGAILFLGRKDHQIKLRGYRIEVGEIQSVINQQSHVEDSLVAVVKRPDGIDQLVAWVVSSKTQEQLLLPITNAVSAALPKFMLPDAWVVLDSFPLTPNGKVDRKALPLPNWGERSNKLLLPRNETELALAEIWAEVLNLSDVGVQDNFFDLGGHSLLATQVASRVRNKLGCTIQIRDLMAEPTIEALALRVAKMQNQQQDLPLLAVDRNQRLPLSFAQQRLWLLDKIEGNTLAYHVPSVLRIQGALDVSVLEKALSKVFNRHEGLRAIFKEDDQGPHQAILEERHWPLPIESVPGNGNDQEFELKRLAAIELMTPFDMSTGPLFRAKLFKLSDSQFVFSVVIHHIVTDGWSMNLLIRDLVNAYVQIAHHGDVYFEKANIQYADFSVWQRARLGEEKQNELLSYWSQQLDSVEPLMLPLDFSRPAVQSFNGKTERFHLPETTVQGFKSIAKNNSSSLFSVLMAAFSVLLQRYSGQSDFAIGTPVAGRDHTELENVVGFFVNTLAVRVKPEAQLTFDELVKQVSDTLLAGFAHQEMPFEQIVEAVDPARDMSRSPLFQVMLAYQNLPIDQHELGAGDALGEIQLSAYDPGVDSSKYDITLTLWDENEQLGGSLQYNTDLFSQQTIQRLIQHFIDLSAALAAASQESDKKPIYETSFLSAGEVEQQLVEWNLTDTDHNCQISVHDRLAQSAQQFSDHIAVVCGDASYTYEQLDLRSNQLAHYLISKGVQSEDRVAICVDRHIDLLTVVLGVLKAGATYVPLDGGYPSERLAYIIEAANIKRVIAFDHLASNLPNSCETHLWERVSETFVTLPTSSPDVSVSPDQLLYLIFTSGSTGKPKGTGAYHRSEINLLNWYCGEFNMTAQDKVLLLSAIGFDLTQKNLFAPLMVGACVVIPEFQEYDSQLIASLIERQQVSWVNCAPSAFYPLQDEPHNWSQLSSLRLLFLGGEAINLSRLQPWLDRSACQLINSYGPTECTDIATWYPVNVSADVGSPALPIGRPNYNVKLYVLGDNLELLPIGAIGELCISGAGVGPGYINNQEQTQAAFVSNPFDSDQPRLYKTGDRVRYRANGLIEYLGRKDHQLKIRGYRVEAGEIQGVINAQPGVKESLVSLITDDNAVQRLVAWVVCSKEVDENDLQSACAEFLPAFMVPELWVKLEAFPLTPNGKVDRKALPQPTLNAADDYIAPSTQLEQQVCDAWAQCLGVQKVGVNQNFFKLGGQSLLATQLVTKLSKILGTPIPVRLLFENPTVQGFIQKARSLTETEQKPVIRPRENKEHAPLSFGQQRLWFFEKLNPGTHANNMPVVLRIKGVLDEALLNKVFNELVRRHEALRTHFIESDSGEPIQVITQSLSFSLPVEDLNSMAEEDANSVIDQEIAKLNTSPISLASAPLFSAKLIKHQFENQPCSTLLLCMHHIISDGASQVVVFRELMTLYLAYSQGQPSPLPELAIHYPDFAQWQRDWMTPQTLDGHLQYWQNQLKGAPVLLEMPLDYPRPKVQTTKGSTASFAFDEQFTQQLTQVCSEHGVTPFMFMLLGWKLLLTRYSGQNDILIGVPTLGRDSPELDNVIGFFIQSLVLRSQFGHNPTVEQALADMKATVLDGFSHGDVPVDLIVERLGVPRNPSYSPLVQVAFQLLDQAGFNVDTLLQNASVGDLQVEVLGGQTASSKFDLTMNLTLSGDQLSGSLEYNTTLFKQDTIEKLIAHYQRLCSQMLAGQSLPINALTLLDSDQLVAELELNADAIEQVLPLSAMQYDMFMDNLIHPESLQSSHGWHIHIQRPLDIELWKKSIQYLTDKQPMLRARFVSASANYLDMGYLAIQKQKTVNVQLVDISHQPDQLDAEVKRLIYRPYNVVADDMIGHYVIKLAEDHFVVTTSVHHAVLDGASLHIYWLQLVETYNALEKGVEPPLPVVDFADYVQHDRTQMNTASVLSFWKEQFAHSEPLDFTVPAPVPRPDHFITKERFLSDSHWGEIKRFCRQQRVTPALYFKCLYGLLIANYCRPDGDFVIQETMGGRVKGHSEGYGCYIQEIPFVFSKDSLKADAAFDGLLLYAKQFQKRIKNQRLISIGKQIELNPRGRIGFMFNFYQFLHGVDFLGQTHYPEGTPSDPANNVQFVVTEVQNKLKLNLFYHGHLFADFDMLNRIEAISEQFLSGKAATLGQLAWVSESNETLRLLESWNDTQRNYDLSLCVHQKFEQQALLTPEAVAIVDDTGSYGYRALNEKANQLAHYLISQGVEQNDLIGLCAERSCEFLVGILGIMKAGAAYVPMDPKYPDDRIRYMIDNSCAKVLITQQSLLDKVATDSDTITLCLDRDAPLLSNQSTVNPNLQQTPRDRAYMIYTSGSTGLPKGAIVRHDGALNHIEAEREVLAFSGSFSFLQTAPASSDISVWQFLGPVTCGGTVVVLDDVTHSKKLFQLVKHHGIDVVELVPVALQLLMEYVRTLPLDERALPDLRWMMATGEAVSVDLVNEWLALYPDIPVVNAYGPTEAADDVIQCAISKPLPANQRSVPIGKPLPNLSVYILDDQRRLLPAGVAGEICIGGIGVGEGYWNNPEKTASAFVANPFKSGEVIYRTGDLGRWLADGSVEYLDRVDNQVKVRGFRIELGEVESALSSLPGVRENVVIVRDDLPGGTALAAYVVATEQVSSLDATTLRAQMRESVPDFMVPASITVMDQLPLTPAGKIDRKALPRPESIQLGGGEYIEPRNNIERDIASIWESLMPLERISVRDNFFEIGGHSLIGVRIIARINKAFNTQLQVAALLKAQTIENLAKMVEQGETSDSVLVPIAQNENSPVFMVHPVGGDVLCYADLAQALSSEFSVYGLRAQGLDGATQPFESMEQMASAYVEAILEQQPQGAYRLVGQSLGGIIAMAVASKLIAQGHRVSQVVMLDTFSPAHLASNSASDSAILASAMGGPLPEVQSQEETGEKSEAYIAQLYSVAQQSGAVPKELTQQQFAALYRVAIQNHTIATQYKVENLPVSVHHFTAADNLTGQSSAQSWQGQLPFASAQSVPGGHETMMQGINAKPLASKLIPLLNTDNNNE